MRFKTLAPILLALTLIISMGWVQSTQAIEWVGTNQSTIAWNAVSTNESGGGIPSGDTIKYRIYQKTYPNGAEETVGDTESLQFTLTFSKEGRYVVGVQTVRIPQGQTEELVSAITWSDSTDTAAVPDPFGIVYYERPSAPSGLSQ